MGAEMKPRRLLKAKHLMTKELVQDYFRPLAGAEMTPKKPKLNPWSLAGYESTIILTIAVIVICLTIGLIYGGG
jgi:hypothetical protein